MGDDNEHIWKSFRLEVCVTDPVSFSSPFYYSHTSFNISIKTNHPAFSLQHSEVRRRFSEFKWLRNVLQRHHPARDTPALPSRALFVWNRFSHEFLECRRGKLETFINRVIAIPCYLGEKAFHLFVQSTLSTRDIELNLLGQRDDVIGPSMAAGNVISPGDIDSNKVGEMCYGEDALTLVHDDGYGSSDNNGALYLKLPDVEEIRANGLPWFVPSSSEVLEESSPVMLRNALEPAM